MSVARKASGTRPWHDLQQSSFGRRAARPIGVVRMRSCTYDRFSDGSYRLIGRVRGKARVKAAKRARQAARREAAR